MRQIIIAIDGPASAGKSTLAKALAKELGYVHVDSGSMYRAVSLYFLRNKVDYRKTADVLQALEGIEITFRNGNSERQTYLNGEDVEQAIRTMAVSQIVSDVSAIPEVRRAMVALQRRVAADRGVVMDGRDIGTVVFPDAELKIFMEAAPDTRALRRHHELKKKGLDVSHEDVRLNLEERDRIDQEREVSPLRRADDALVLDNSKLTEQEQLDWALERARKVIEGTRL